MIDEEIKKAPRITLKVPEGESFERYVENYLGVLPTSEEEMPMGEDVEATVIIRLE